MSLIKKTTFIEFIRLQSHTRPFHLCFHFKIPQKNDQFRITQTRFFISIFNFTLMYKSLTFKESFTCTLNHNRRFLYGFNNWGCVLWRLVFRTNPTYKRYLAGKTATIFTCMQTFETLHKTFIYQFTITSLLKNVEFFIYLHYNFFSYSTKMSL